MKNRRDYKFPAQLLCRPYRASDHLLPTLLFAIIFNAFALPWQREKNPISQLFIERTAMVNLNENNPVVAFCCVVSCFVFVQLR